MRILFLTAALTAAAASASAQSSLADYGLDETIPAEVEAFADVVDAMQKVQDTSGVGLELFAHYADTQVLDDDMRLSMQRWESLAAMTWLQFNQAIDGAESLIDERVAAHCHGDAVVVPDCQAAMEDRVEFATQYVKMLRGMSGFDLIQTGIGEVLN